MKLKLNKFFLPTAILASLTGLSLPAQAEQGLGGASTANAHFTARRIRSLRVPEPNIMDSRWEIIGTWFPPNQVEISFGDGGYTLTLPEALDGLWHGGTESPKSNTIFYRDEGCAGTPYTSVADADSREPIITGMVAKTTYFVSENKLYVFDFSQAQSDQLFKSRRDKGESSPCENKESLVKAVVPFGSWRELYDLNALQGPFHVNRTY